MKVPRLFAVFVAFAAGILNASTSPVNKRLAGAYTCSVPGSVWTLTLSGSGHYSLTTRGGLEKSERPIESGTWRFEGIALVLDSKQPPVSGGEYRRLHVLQKKRGQLMLVSAVRSESYIGQPLGSDALFDYVFVRLDAPGADQKNEAIAVKSDVRPTR